MPSLFRTIDAIPVPVLYLLLVCGAICVLTGAGAVIGRLLACMRNEWVAWRYRRVRRAAGLTPADLRATLRKRYDR